MRTYPTLTSFALWYHSLTHLLVFPGITSQINHLHLNLCLKVCFWGSKLRHSHSYACVYIGIMQTHMCLLTCSHMNTYMTHSYMHTQACSHILACFMKWLLTYSRIHIKIIWLPEVSTPQHTGLEDSSGQRKLSGTELRALQLEASEVSLQGIVCGQGSGSICANKPENRTHPQMERDEVCRQTVLQTRQTRITFLPVHTYPPCVSPSTLHIRMHSACAVSFPDTSFIFLCSNSPPSLSGRRAEGLPPPAPPPDPRSLEHHLLSRES